MQFNFFLCFIFPACEDEIGLWWSAVICAAASWRLGEEDSKAWSIVESKFPYERNFQIGDNNSSSSPLPHAVLNVLQAAKHSTKLMSMRFIDQAGLLLEQSMVYYHCKEQSSQQILVNLSKYSRWIFIANNCFINIVFVKREVICWSDNFKYSREYFKLHIFVLTKRTNKVFTRTFIKSISI